MENLIRRRAGHRGHVTKLLKTYDDHKDSRTSEAVQRVQYAATVLSEKLKTLSGLDEQILSGMERDENDQYDIVQEITDTGEYMDDLNMQLQLMRLNTQEQPSGHRQPSTSISGVSVKVEAPTAPSAAQDPVGTRSPMAGRVLGSPALSAGAGTGNQTTPSGFDPTVYSLAPPLPRVSAPSYNVPGASPSLPSAPLYATSAVPPVPPSTPWSPYVSAPMMPGSSPWSVGGQYPAAVRAKLPKISLRDFHGNSLEWFSFWENFTSLVHGNAALSDVDKFAYLKSVLQGDAAHALDGLSLTGANYPTAVALLQERFGDRQKIITQHMDGLLKLDAATSSSNVVQLRKLLDTIDVHVRSLDNIGQSPTSYGSMFVPILLTKLPADVRLAICEKVPATCHTLPRILQQLRVEIENRERAATVGVGMAMHTSPLPSHRPGKPTASALAVGSEQKPRSQGAVTCVYCGQGHDAKACTMVTDVKRRKMILRRDGRCFVCLKRNHVARTCASKLRCAKCQQRHHTTICEPRPEGGNAESVTTATNIGGADGVLLQTAQAMVTSPQASVRIRLILDGGSQRSYVTERVRALLALDPSRTEATSINPFGSTADAPPQQLDVVDVCLALPDGERLSVPCLCVPTICAPVNNQYPASAARYIALPAGATLADDCSGTADIDLLIGADMYWQLVDGNVVRSTSGPTALSTRLGWVLSGPTGGPLVPGGGGTVMMVSTTPARVQPSSLVDPDAALLQQLRQFWELESLGILPNSPTVLETFQQTLQYDGERYTVTLPWREFHRALPDNYQLCVKRLKSTLLRLRREPVIAAEYDAIIQDQLKRGIIERVPGADAAVGETHYLPHHPVVRQDKSTTKVRVVYDASAKVGSGPSLNECLYAGPPMLEHIPDVLLRFRAYEVAVTADIEKAFLMVGVADADRDALRFLWVDDIHSEPPRIVQYRFTRVVFGVSSSPFLLNATLQHHLGQYVDSDPEFVHQLLKSLYVDDVTGGGHTAAGAHAFYTKAKTRLADGGFNLRKFASNSKELMTLVHGATDAPALPDIPQRPVVEDSDTYATSELNGSSPACDKVLGIPWNRSQDQLVLDLSSLFANAAVRVTKRQVLAASAQVFDPLGYVCPVTVAFKILHQELCKAKISWDEPLAGGALARWQELVSDLQAMKPVTLPRWYMSGVEGDVSSTVLHGFCDASQQAYAAVVYMVISTNVGVYVRLVAARTRVAPLAAQTIPRLELLAALVLARLVQSVSASLSDVMRLDGLHCWTDSKVALAWITGVQHDWKQFVQNRVSEIRKLVPLSVWSYCPTASNPADLPSRGTKAQELTNTIWFTGPDWLRTSPVGQPTTADAEVSSDLVAAELRKSDKTTTLLVTRRAQPNISSVIDISRFSTRRRLLRVTALVMRAVQVFKHQAPAGEVTANEVIQAEKLWLQDVQRHLVKDSKFPQWEREFGILRGDDDLLRCGGRLQNADLSFDQSHPILLSQGHPYTELVVIDCHEAVMHNGVKETLTEVRARFWIVRGRQHIRKLLHKCRVCRRYESMPYRTEAAPALPNFRTTVAFPFAYTGVDFAGPLFVQQGANVQKTYIALFTCGVSRAVHLDLVPDLSAEAFLRCFKRFTARFGVPREMKSDNAKTFKSASKALAALFDVPEIACHLAARGVKWSFNLERAPWWGGFFERLVRSVKRCLKKTLHQARLSYEELQTVLFEVEAVLNSRPLSFVSSEDLEEPLTPSHLIYGRRILSCPAVDPDDVHISGVQAEDLLKRLVHIKNLSDHFWSRWTKEYLLELRNAHRSNQSRRNGEEVRVGDVVVVAEDDKQRGLWKLGLVESLITGADGKVRGAVVKSASGGGRPNSLRRPVQKLYPVEVSVKPTSAATTPPVSPPPAAAPATATEGRPQRAAACSAADRLRQLIDSGAL